MTIPEFPMRRAPFCNPVLQRPRFARNYDHDAPAGASSKVNPTRVHAEVPELKVLYRPRKYSTSLIQ
jgi:hypothetical protein